MGAGSPGSQVDRGPWWPQAGGCPRTVLSGLSRWTSGHCLPPGPSPPPEGVTGEDAGPGVSGTTDLGQRTPSDQPLRRAARSSVGPFTASGLSCAEGPLTPPPAPSSGLPRTPDLQGARGQPSGFLFCLVASPCADSCPDMHGRGGWRLLVCSATGGPTEPRWGACTLPDHQAQADSLPPPSFCLGPTKGGGGRGSAWLLPTASGIPRAVSRQIPGCLSPAQLVRSEPPQTEGAGKAVVGSHPREGSVGERVSEPAAECPLTAPVCLRCEAQTRETGTRVCTRECAHVCAKRLNPAGLSWGRLSHIRSAPASPAPHRPSPGWGSYPRAACCASSLPGPDPGRERSLVPTSGGFWARVSLHLQEDTLPLS